MKKLFILINVALLIFFASCEKNEQIATENETKISDSKIDCEGQFKKEIIVKDKSGKNSVYFAIYSDDQNLLESYLKSHNFDLIVSTDDNVSFSQPTNDVRPKSSTKDFAVEQKPAIIVDEITSNLQNDVSSYYLEVKRKELKSSNGFLFGTPVGYTTKKSFIGIAHKGFGHILMVQLRYKENWWNINWHTIEAGGANTKVVYQTGSDSHICMGSSYNVYKRGITVFPHLYQYQTNYIIAYYRNDYRGQNCSLGTYDTWNCYVGSAPEGTEAFIWENNFYYSPVNGNQCPYPGSHYDGVNCHVMTIPDDCEPFIYNNNWYVEPDVIY